MNNYQAHEIQITTGTIEISNAYIWYTKFYTTNSEHNIPLLALHGGPGFTHQCLLALKQLALTNPIILYDQSGCGNSKLKKSKFNDWTLGHYTQELDQIIMALNYKKLYLLGFSWGGTLAAHYTATHQKKLAGLILASPLLNTKQWIADCKTLAESLSPELYAIMLKHDEANSHHEQEYQDAANTFYKNFYCRLDPWPSEVTDGFTLANMQIYKTMWGPAEMTSSGTLKDLDLSNDLRKIKIPTLVTCGRFDMATPKTMEQYTKLIPHAKLIIFKKSAHKSITEETELYIKKLQEFFQIIENS